MAAILLNDEIHVLFPVADVNNCLHYGLDRSDRSDK